MKKILIANRGEIACRVIRTAQKMGISTVAVYSEVDRESPHVRMADEAFCIGPAASAESYLRADKIIEIAKQTGTEGIHPGYGFLSENAGFAKAVTEAGIIFIGPRPHAIEVMGSKLAAKEAVLAYDIPMVPGTDEAVTDIDAAIETAKEIGFPILVKASAGGGGKGMRIVENASEFKEQMDRAISEAESAFGDGSVFIEKYVKNPRHIEFQVLADNHGNVVHLFERECSVQRRHQKVVEEAPSVLLTPELRDTMGQAATRVAKACNYTGAGTVEFLVDADLNYYFLEMNTRLQVEHPVTEEITGLDLVEQQIKVARNEVLSLKQEDLKIRGHSIELRVYAEDPEDNFMPSTGNLNVYKRATGEGVRLDDGYDQGMDIPIYYDPMISKLITTGANRMEAIGRMLQAIADYDIEGVTTTLPFGQFVLQHEAFRSGNFDTGFVKKYYTPEKLSEMKEKAREAAAFFVLKHFLQEEKRVKPAKITPNAGWFSSRK